MIEAWITIFPQIQTLSVPHLALVQINHVVEWIRFRPEGALEGSSEVAQDMGWLGNLTGSYRVE
jgi:hypothetical protein